MKVHVNTEDNPEKRLLWEARHKIDFSTEEFFHHAFEYNHETRVVRCSDVQKKFIRYLHSGGTNIPPEVIDFSLDILAGRVNPHQNS